MFLVHALFRLTPVPHCLRLTTIIFPLASTLFPTFNRKNIDSFLALHPEKKYFHHIHALPVVS